MTAWLAALWAKVGTWIAAIGAVLLALAGAVLYGRVSGAKAQETKDKAADADARVQAAQAAAQVHVDAAQAAADVQQKAQQQPPPNVVKRDDFDSTF